MDKNNLLPTVSTPDPHLRSPERLLVSIALPTSPASRQSAFSETSHRRIFTRSSQPTQASLRFARIPRDPILLFMPSLLAVSSFNMSAPICSTSWSGRTFQTLRLRVFIRSFHKNKRFTHPQTLGRITPWCSRHMILLTVLQDLL